MIDEGLRLCLFGYNRDKDMMVMQMNENLFWLHPRDFFQLMQDGLLFHSGIARMLQAESREQREAVDEVEEFLRRRSNAGSEEQIRQGENAEAYSGADGGQASDIAD